jgi:hypothetical protein
LLRRINYRGKRKNMDSRIIVTGEGGIGKSWTGLRLGEKLDPKKFVDQPELAVEENVHFFAEEFMQAVRTLPKLSVLLFDEPGQEWHHREFMQEVNIVLSKTYIGFRFKKFISILCIPYLQLLDKDARVLCQFKIDVLDQGYAEAQRIKPSRWTDEIWYPPLCRLRIDKPNQRLIDAYEKKKVESQEKLYEIYHNVLKSRRKKDITNDELMEAILENPAYYKKNPDDDKLHTATLMSAFDIGRDRAYTLKAKYRLIKREGND